MIGGVTRLGGLPGLPGDPPRRVARSARQGNPVSRGDSLPCKRVKVGNPPSRDCVHSKKLKSETCMLLNFAHFPAVSWQKSPETATDIQGV